MALKSVLIGGFSKFQRLRVDKRTPAAILEEFNTGGSKKDAGGTPLYLQCGENPDIWRHSRHTRCVLPLE